VTIQSVRREDGAKKISAPQGAIGKSHVARWESGKPEAKRGLNRNGNQGPDADASANRTGMSPESSENEKNKKEGRGERWQRYTRYREEKLKVGGGDDSDA